MVVQLIQNLVWILLSGESNGPSMDLNGFEWLVVKLATNTDCSKGILLSGNFEWFQMVKQ